MKKAIKQLKYRFVRDLACEITAGIPITSHNIWMYLNQDSTVFVPIPLHPTKLRYRGFNQAEMLGRLVSNQLGIPMVSDLLVRTKKTPPQAETESRKERHLNIAHAFHLNSKYTKNIPKNVIIFDDVYTTGATLKEAAKSLKRAGVEKVWGMTIAR